MKYGYFDDKKREYVITRPDTPAPWVNYKNVSCNKYSKVIRKHKN